MQMTFSSLLVWITILSSSYWYHSPKMKELVQFRDAIIDSCVIYANDLESCIHNLQRQLFNKKKTWSRLSFNHLSPHIHNTSIQCPHFHKGHNSSRFVYAKSSYRKSTTDISPKYLTEEKAFLIAGNYDKLSKQQLASNELIQSLSVRIEDYETELHAMKAYMEILHKSLNYAVGNMTQQTGDLNKLAVKDSSIEAQMKVIQEAVKISQHHLRHSIHIQKNSSEWLKASLQNLTHSEQKMIDLYQHLFQLQIKEDKSKSNPQNINFDEFKLLFYSLAAGELLLFVVLIIMSCWRPNRLDINDNSKPTFTFSPRNGFQCKPNLISSETILDEIRQRQLGDFVCSLSFTNRNQLHQQLTDQIQREMPDLQVEYFRVEYLNDIPSLPWAKTFLIFFDLKQKNGIDPIKGTNDIKLTVVKAVQRMGADIFMICTGDENSCQLQNSEALFHRSLKFLKTYHEVARLISCKRVVSVKDSFFPHQINHITNAINVWYEILD